MLHLIMYKSYLFKVVHDVYYQESIRILELPLCYNLQLTSVKLCTSDRLLIDY